MCILRQFLGCHCYRSDRSLSLEISVPAHLERPEPASTSQERTRPGRRRAPGLFAPNRTSTIAIDDPNRGSGSNKSGHLMALPIHCRGREYPSIANSRYLEYSVEERLASSSRIMITNGPAAIPRSLSCISCVWQAARREGWTCEVRQHVRWESLGR